MGVPAKKQSRKGKKGSQKAKKVTMWGGSPASAMLYDDLANPTNPGNYLDADIPLVANQTKAPLTGGSGCSARPTMTGGSLSSSAVVNAVNTVREPGAMLNDYEAGMDLTGCGSKKAVMKGGSAASNRVLSHVNLPSVLEPQAVTSSVPDYLSLDPAARPQNYQLTGGNPNNNNFGQGPPQRQYAMAPEQMPQPARPPVVEDIVEPVVSHGKGAKASKPRRNKRAKNTVKHKGSGKRTSKRLPITGGASGFWSGVAGCGPVNVPNAGNNLSRFFTKSSSCPGPEFYANPPGLGSAGSGYATELPSGAPFPFI